MVRLVIIRLVNKKNPFERDLNHFHHLLLKKMNLLWTIIFYLTLSFGPLIFSKLTDLSIIFLIPFSVIFYFYIVNKFSKSND